MHRTFEMQDNWMDKTFLDNYRGNIIFIPTRVSDLDHTKPNMIFFGQYHSR